MSEESEEGEGGCGTNGRGGEMAAGPIVAPARRRQIVWDLECVALVVKLSEMSMTMSWLVVHRVLKRRERTLVRKG